MKYTSKQICEMFDISRERLRQLRSGFTYPDGRFLKPKINEGSDWAFERGTIYHYKSAIDKLRKYYKK